ncbi:MAG: hypothetical protein Q7S98_00955 [Deltaproteobacteria bacterium]|nr:hypothetical protein [Deltaproteobacteria bacterium]
MITLSNRHSFQFMVASGALSFDGRGWPWEWPLRWCGLLDPSLFTIVTKTLTRLPRPGNLRWSHPWSVVKKIDGEGAINSIGLTNKGIDWWCQKVAPSIPANYKIIASIEAKDRKELVEMIRLLEGKKILGLELNLSCPNSPSGRGSDTSHILELCREAKKHSPYPLIAKLSFTHDYVRIAKELEGVVEAIAINSIPWKAIFGEKQSPLARYGGGGVSGKVVQPFTWKMVDELSKSTKIPVIGPSVWEYDDIQILFDKGAQAIGFGSIFLSYPWRPTLYVKRWLKNKP